MRPPAGVEHVRAVTRHRRVRPEANAFAYALDLVLLEPEARPQGPALFGLDARRPMALRTRDQGGPVGAGRGAAWAREALGPDDPGGRLLLLAQPRVAGHAFNPVAFWLALDAQDRLRAVLAEVTNTYGDRHAYLCRRPDGGAIGPADAIRAPKALHVSPFQEGEGRYTFRFDLTGAAIRIRIELRTAEGGLTATLEGARAPLTNAGVLGALLRRPLGTRRGLGLIHWQALRLWRKGARFRERPAPPGHGLTR